MSSQIAKLSQWKSSYLCLGLLFGLLLLLAACSGDELSSPEASPTTEPTLTATKAPSPTPTLSPTPESIEVEVEGVSFSYDQALANTIKDEKIPAQLLGIDGGSSYFRGVPDYAYFTFNVETPGGRPSTLVIQPIKDGNGDYYGTLDNFYRAEIERLVAQLAETPSTSANPADIQLAYLDFASGEGVRTISYLPSALGPEPITNQEIYYVFRGLTSDGSMQVVLNYSISTDVLSDTASLTAEELQTIANDSQGYITGIMDSLASLSAEQFTPQLALLDEMIASLSVDSAAFTTVSVPLNPPDCYNDTIFVSDVNIPDNTVINPGETFIKTWRARNVGTCTLSVAEGLIRLSGQQIEWLDSTPLDLVPPNEEFEISVTLTAPEAPGFYESYWTLQSSAPYFTSFGAEFYVVIEVAAEEEGN